MSDEDMSNYKTEIITDINVKNDLFAKVEIVGDLEVGKSSIMRRILNDDFIEEYSPTQGYEFTPYLIKINDTVLKFQIWDMCGNENYRSVLLNLYRNAVLGILVYAINSRQSFDNLENWITQLKKNALPDSRIILLGNKSDDNDNRKVTFEEGKALCDKYNLDFFMEVSAKNGFTSPNFLEKAAINLYKDYEMHKEDNEYSLSLANRNESIMLRNRKSFSNKRACC